MKIKGKVIFLSLIMKGRDGRHCHVFSWQSCYTIESVVNKKIRVPVTVNFKLLICNMMPVKANMECKNKTMIIPLTFNGMDGE
jgi:hypothetical protein